MPRLLKWIGTGLLIIGCMALAVAIFAIPTVLLLVTNNFLWMLMYLLPIAAYLGYAYTERTW